MLAEYDSRPICEAGVAAIGHDFERAVAGLRQHGSVVDMGAFSNTGPGASAGTEVPRIHRTRIPGSGALLNRLQAPDGLKSGALAACDRERRENLRQAIPSHWNELCAL